jgi:hypothetical protein
MRFFKLYEVLINKDDNDFITKFIALVNARKNPFDKDYFYQDGQTLVKFKLIPGFLKPGSVLISDLHTIPNKTGAGKRFLEKLTQLADETNTWLELSAVPLKTDEKIPAQKLNKFYDGFGFEKIKGDSQNTMVRKPADPYAENA